jgi:uncharacterized phage protein gp47/JayE
MVIFYEDKYSELMSNAMQELRATTDISQLTPGAKARALLEIVNREIGAAYRTFSSDFLKGYIKEARGENLDLIGDLMGLTRGQATRNDIESSNQIQKFYIDNGTFGSINTINGVATSFTIPAGVLIESLVPAGQQSIQYRLDENVVCAAGETSAYGAIQAVEYGTVSNVGAGSLTQHNFELYQDYLAGSLKTKNIEGIAFASDVESDANFRYRIINQTLASEGANRVSIRMAALSVPGVADVWLDEYSHGIGTGAVYIKGVTPVVNESLLATVQSAIASIKAFSSFIDVKAPSLVGVEMIVGLNLIQRRPQREEDALVARVRDTLYGYINGLDINQELDTDMLVRKILRVDSNIKSIGVPTRQIEYLYIWRESAAEDNRVRRLATEGYQARNFERIVIEYTELPEGDEPIRIRILS